MRKPKRKVVIKYDLTMEELEDEPKAKKKSSFILR